MEPIARSKDYEKLSVKKLDNEYKSKHVITEHIFDSVGRYVPSKEYVRNKKQYIKQEESLKNSMNGRFYLTAKKETAYRINILLNKIEIEIFKKKIN